MRTFFKRSLIFSVVYLVVFVCLIIYIYQFDSSDKQFSKQAQSFLHGRQDIAKSNDAIFYKGHYFWHQPPFPSVILIPFQILSPTLNESHVQLILIPILIFFAYRTAKLKKFNTVDALYLVFAFLFASVVINFMAYSGSYFFAQMVAITLLVVVIYEFETKRRFLVLGLLIGALLATRPIAALIGILILFFLIKSRKDRIKNFLFFSIPIFISVCCLLWFNYIRFGSFTVDTYQLSDTRGPFAYSKSLGIFSIQHVPSNLYFYFLASVEPITNETAHLVFPFITYNLLGLSLFIICPFFLYALRTLKSKDGLIRGYWVTTIISLLVLLSFFGSGYASFGPRYVADFFPILFLLLLHSFPTHSLTKKQKVFILLSGLFNSYLLLTPFMNL